MLICWDGLTLIHPVYELLMEYDWSMSTVDLTPLQCESVWSSVVNQYQSISININQYQSISININQYQSHSCRDISCSLHFRGMRFALQFPNFWIVRQIWNLALEEPRLQDFHFWSGEMSCWAKIRNGIPGARECARIRIRMVLNQRRSKEYLFQIQLTCYLGLSELILNGTDHRSCRVLWETQDPNAILNVDIFIGGKDPGWYVWMICRSIVAWRWSL